MIIYAGKDYYDVSRKAANIMSAQIIMKPRAVLGLATGSTPIGMYKQLIEWYKKGDLDFSQVTSVNLDEYKGLSEDNDQSYRYFMNTNLFDHVNIDKSRTYVPNGLEEDSEKACADYNEIIRSVGGVDMQLLGIGGNGHIGFNEPGEAFEKETPQGPVRFVNLRARFGKAPNFLDPVRGLLTCHIDTKRGIAGFTGANDGASGAAAILETARILSGDPARAGNLELVFFDGEESFAEHMDSDDGLYGSRHYASSMRQPLPEWMINLDMVGRQGKKIRIPAMTPQSMYRVYSRAIRELGYSPEEWGVSGYAILDDHVPFMERGVDTLNLIDDFQDGNWWHTSKDNIGILGEKSFQQTGEMTLHILRQLLPGPPSA